MAKDDQPTTALGRRYVKAVAEREKVGQAVREAIRTDRAADPEVSVAELSRRYGMQRQGVYEALGMKRGGGGRSRGRSGNGAVPVEASVELPARESEWTSEPFEENA